MAMETWVKLVNIGLGNVLLPNGTKPSPEPMLFNHQWGPVTITWRQFHKRCSCHQPLQLVWKLLEIYSTLPGANELAYHHHDPREHISLHSQLKWSCYQSYKWICKYSFSRGAHFSVVTQIKHAYQYAILNNVQNNLSVRICSGGQQLKMGYSSSCYIVCKNENKTKNVLRYISLTWKLYICYNLPGRKTTCLNHFNLVITYDATDLGQYLFRQWLGAILELGQYWFRQWLGAWWHQAITWAIIDSLSMRSCCIVNAPDHNR